MSRVNMITIKTPEGISFSFQLAGPVSRFLAWIVDLCCISVCGILLGSVANLLQILSAQMAQVAVILGYFAISMGYGILFETLWKGQTFGKRLFRLRVMDEDGLRLQFSQVVVRNLLRVADALPILYLLGGVACLLSRKAQRLGDFAANTVVVHHPRVSLPDIDQVIGGKFNSFRPYPHLVGRLRQRVSPQEAGLALQALLRRQELEPGARVELFADLARHFRSLVEFPQEATEGLSDEQVIRNLVDLLFRSA